MKAWHDLLRKVQRHGTHRQDRTGVGTLAVFAEVLKVSNTNSFPAVTTKQLAFKQCAAEMACFIRGNHSLHAFHHFGCTVWDGNGNDPRWVSKPADQGGPQFEGDLGRIYGVQWRNWQSDGGKWPGGEEKGPVSTDQLRNLVDGLAADPFGRRHLVTAWNPGELSQMCLPPCPVLFQCFRAEARLDMVVYQRSCDLFLGLPFDIAGYALLQRLIAKELGIITGELTFFIGDAHIYMNHMNQVEEVLKRKPAKAPTLFLDPAATLWDFEPAHVKLMDYLPYAAISAPLNV